MKHRHSTSALLLAAGILCLPGCGTPLQNDTSDTAQTTASATTTTTQTTEPQPVSETTAAIPDGTEQYTQILYSRDLTPIANNNFTEYAADPLHPYGWSAERPGAISFTVTAQRIGILYAKTADGSCGQYDVYVDSEPVKTLDGNLTGGGANHAASEEIFAGSESAQHTVMLKMADNSSAPGFRLLAVLVS